MLAHGNSVAALDEGEIRSRYLGACVRTLLLSIAAAAVAAAAAAPAAAETVTVRDERGGECARATFTPDATGVVTARLRAAGGDWDLSVADARTGHVHARGATVLARETVTVAGTAGRPLRASACRLRGGAETARIAFELHPAAPADRSFPARLVRVPLAGPESLERLEATGLDVTHNVTDRFADVVLYSAAEQADLLRAGFLGETRIGDLRAETARTLAQASSRPLPSGQATYRTPAEYSQQMKNLAAKFPAIARSVVVGTSLEGRPIEGVELAADVGATDDGRPTFLVLGLHHAREWPSGEMPMEFVLDIADEYGSNARVTQLLQRARILAVPVVNVDGFEVSRLAGPMPGDDNPFATLPLIATDSAAYKRKNCRPTAGSEAVPCATRPTVQGVDLNRNYGAFWGGVGSSTDPTDQTFRGPAPYSEPESEAIHKLSSTRPITLVISHHTYTEPGVWLRQPGFCKSEGACSAQEDVVPDEAGMAALGEAMHQATGWRSALGWDIGEITGATEDWNYFTQGAYGYTPEQRGVNFHPNYEDAVVREYTGEDAGGRGGVREALLLAAETAADPARHAVLSGSAPAGRTLRLTKAFDTPTSQPNVVVKDKLDFTLKVPASGRFTWHVNQSTRPLSTFTESYALTCETPDGRVLERRDVVVARGQSLVLDLGCGQPPGTATRPAVAPTLTVRAGSPSARRANRTRRLAIRLQTAGGEVRRVKAWLQRRGKTVARGTLPRVGGGIRKLSLRRVTKIRAGEHTLLVEGTAPTGVVRVTVPLRVKK